MQLASLVPLMASDPWGGNGSIPSPDSEVKVSFVVGPYP